MATFVLAIFFKSVTAKAANWGLLSGVGFNMVLWLGVPQVFWFWWNAAGFLASLGAALIVTALTRRRHAPPQAVDVAALEALPIRETVILIAAFGAILATIGWFPSLWHAVAQWLIAP
ncbi:MAG: hypothetical protein D6782_12140 [Alphaproteobacteria bacterium]|nr:MAG: hypothetical protein D6782_12140 [Alphaproteobacteria bacterium]